MKLHSIISAAIITVFSTGLCLADTLVITYRSGKTQTVTLDEPSTTINSWQFVGGTAATTPAIQPQAVPAKDAVKTPEKAPDKKSNVRFNWNAKPIPD